MCFLILEGLKTIKMASEIQLFILRETKENGKRAPDFVV